MTIFCEGTQARIFATRATPRLLNFRRDGTAVYVVDGAVDDVTTSAIGAVADHVARCTSVACVCQRLLAVRGDDRAVTA